MTKTLQTRYDSFYLELHAMVTPEGGRVCRMCSKS